MLTVQKLETLFATFTEMINTHRDDQETIAGLRARVATLTENTAALQDPKVLNQLDALQDAAERATGHQAPL
jgi:uncharacterized membrane protein (DUF106 family)